MNGPRAICLELDDSQDASIAEFQPALERLCRNGLDLTAARDLALVADLGLFTVLATESGGLGFSLTAYAKLLATVAEQHSHLATCMAAVNQLWLLPGERPDFSLGRLDYWAEPWDTPPAAAAVPGGNCRTLLVPTAINRLFLPLATAESERCVAIFTNVTAARLLATRHSGDTRYYYLQLATDRHRPMALLPLNQTHCSRLCFKQALDYMAIVYGQLRRAHRLSLCFTENRILFRRKLCDFQSIRVRHADNHASLALLAGLLWAMFELDARHQYDGQEAVLLATFRRLARQLLSDLIQLFGGTGFMEESAVPAIYRRVLELDTAYDRAAAWFSADRPGDPAQYFQAIRAAVLSRSRAAAPAWDAVTALNTRFQQAMAHIENRSAADGPLLNRADEWMITYYLPTLIVLNRIAADFDGRPAPATTSRLLCDYLLCRMETLLASYEAGRAEDGLPEDPS